MGAFDFVSQFAKVLATSINPRTQALQADLTGVGSFTFDEVDDEKGEVSKGSEMFGALGFVSRPANPEVIGGKDFACEALCMRTADGLVPISWRDLRLNAFFPDGVPEGRIGMVGYGGGFHTIDLNIHDPEQNTSTHFLYAPYDFDSEGVPQKAMAISLDTSTPGEENISMSIGGGTSGFQMTMNEADGLQVRTPNENTFFNIREDEINMTATKIVLKGNVYIGSQAEVGIPLLAGPASPFCPSLFVSPV